VTIKDAGLPPNIGEFVDSFSGRACYGLGDIMGGYNERELDPASRPLTTFETVLGRLQLTRLPQGATNSVAVYQAQMTWILQEEIPDHVGIFIDDGGIKGPTSTYKNEKLLENPGMRRFVWEYAITLEQILFRIEEAGLTISGEMFACCVPALDIVGHIVSLEGRIMSKQKVNKILSWPTPRTKKDNRGFLGLCVYVRMFIMNFSAVALPLRRLTRLDVNFEWDNAAEDSFVLLKQIVGEEIFLKNLEYGEGAGKITLAVDSSFIAAGEVLMQEDKEGVMRPVIYESVGFSKRESRYSQSKLELCGVAKTLKKLQTILWGQHFELQVDTKALIEMINTPSLPSAPMTRWVAFIQLYFSFDLVHKPGKTFTMPDSLSRRPRDDDEEEPTEFDKEEAWVTPHPGLGAKESILAMYLPNQMEVNLTTLGLGIKKNKQKGFWKKMNEYLLNWRRPENCSDAEYVKIKRRSPNYFVEEEQLKKRKIPYNQVVVSDPAIENQILKSLHEDLGHRGMAKTYRRVKERFWWEGMKKMARKWVQTCDACQKQSKDLPKEEGIPTSTSTLFQRIVMDAVHVKAGRWKYMVVARDNFSGWAETVGLTKLKSKTIASWFISEWVCWYGIPKEVTVDGGGEFKKELQRAVKKTGIKMRIVTPYYPEAQGMIERGHKEIKDALIKMCGENGSKWKDYLPLVTFADPISTKQTTGYTPFELQFGQPAVLPVDLELRSYLSVAWTKVKTTSDLLSIRADQLAQREENIEKAKEKLKKAREQSVKYWDKRLAHRIQQPLNPGDLVLVYDKALENQWGLLFKNRWNGPYRVVEQINDGPYKLEELDGTHLARRYAASQVKRLFPRGEPLDKDRQNKDTEEQQDEQEEEQEENQDSNQIEEDEENEDGIEDEENEEDEEEAEVRS
jgi:hypothetical protein